MGLCRFFPVVVGALLALGGCSQVVDGTGSATDDATSDVVLDGESKLFPGFSYDTGMQPAVSPVQASFAFKTEGALSVSASGVRRGSDGFEGRARSGKLAIELHAKMEGKLKVDTALKDYDGPIPGLDVIDIAAIGEAAFDPFLLDEGQEVEAVADVPETKLPPIPLGSVPGSLELTVKSGSTVNAKLHGTCLRGTPDGVVYETATATSGKLVLKAVLKMELPKPLDKEVALPDITVDLPATKGKLEAKYTGDAGEFEVGACASGRSASSSSGSSGASSSSGSSGSEASSSGSSGASSGSSSGTTGPAEADVQVRIDGYLRPKMAHAKALLNDDGSIILTISEAEEIYGVPVVFMSLDRLGEGCDDRGIHSVSYMQISYNGGPGWSYDAPTKSSTCGLNVTLLDRAAGGRVKGWFDGNVNLTHGDGMPSKAHVSVAFDVPVTDPS